MKSTNTSNVNKTVAGGSTPSTQNPTTAKPIVQPKTAPDLPIAVPTAQPRVAPVAIPKVESTTAPKKL